VVIKLERLPNKRLNGFDLNVYKLLAKAIYNRENVSKLAKDSGMT
jgi:hypothetical protein